MKFSKSLIFSFFTFLVLCSCRSDKPPVLVKGPSVSGSNRVWICNEGNFQQANSELGIYNPENKEYSPEVYKAANLNSPGDVLQSLNFYNGLAYLIVNNSGKIIVVDTSSFQVQKLISGFTSPRYMLPVGPFKAYVSDLYADAISILDLEKDSIIGKIACGQWTEKMLQFQNKVFVSTAQHDQLFIIDALSDQLIDSIPLAYGSNSLVLDKNNKLWVLCSGSPSENKAAGLFKIDPNSHQILSQWPMDQTKLASHLSINSKGDEIYFLYKDLFKMKISDQDLPSTAFYPANSRIFYGLNIDPLRNEIYLADPIDFVQKGLAIRLDSNANLLSTFRTGFNPNGFYFE